MNIKSQRGTLIRSFNMHIKPLTPLAHIDHLVVAAAALEDGVRWCQNSLGVSPEPGGEHALFGTHNQLLRLNSHAYQQAYLEIIAINPKATTNRDSNQAAWFDLEDPVMKRQLMLSGPQLIHWVVRVPNISQAVAAWRDLGIECGPVIEASRQSNQGLLRWKITVRKDGKRLLGGALPTLIEWGETHPTDAMVEPVITLKTLQLQHPDTRILKDALAVIKMNEISVEQGPIALRATLILENKTEFSLSHNLPHSIKI